MAIDEEKSEEEAVRRDSGNPAGGYKRKNLREEAGRKDSGNSAGGYT